MEIISKQNKANEPTSVVRNQAAPGTPQQGGLCFPLGPEPTQSMAIPGPAAGDR